MSKGIQYIVDNAQSIEISRAKTVGQLVSRSGRIRTAERASTQPWQLIVSPPAVSKYEDVRDVIEGITMIDRANLFYIDFGYSAVTGLNWINEYQGDLNATQVSNLRVSTSTGFLGTGTWDVSDFVNYNQNTSVDFVFDYMRITNLPTLGSTTTNATTFVTSSTLVFKSGDWVQFATSADPWGQTSTYVDDRGLAATVPVDVPRGIGTYVDVPVHRPFVFNGTGTYAINGRAGCEIAVGKNVRLGMIMTKMPSYKLIPGKLVQWSGDFEFYEYIAG